jgi:hypothetical protein
MNSSNGLTISRNKNEPILFYEGEPTVLLFLENSIATIKDPKERTFVLDIPVEDYEFANALEELLPEESYKVSVSFNSPRSC